MSQQNVRLRNVTTRQNNRHVGQTAGQEEDLKNGSLGYKLFMPVKTDL
jgi:hypothetical protein